VQPSDLAVEFDETQAMSGNQPFGVYTVAVLPAGRFDIDASRGLLCSRIAFQVQEIEIHGFHGKMLPRTGFFRISRLKGAGSTGIPSMLRCERALANLRESSFSPGIETTTHICDVMEPGLSQQTASDQAAVSALANHSDGNFAIELR